MKKRLYIIILLMVAFVLPSNAVLKEANLDTTLYMLRTELTNYHIDLEKQNQAAKAQQLAVIQELISIVKQADQNSIMLYSQRNGYIFDMTYACHEATEQFKKFKSKAVPFRQMIKKNNVEVARFDSLINYLYGMNTMFLSEEAQVNRNVDLTLAVNIRRQLVEKQKQLQAYVQAYDRTDRKLQALNDYANRRYEDIQNSIFNNGGDNYLRILRNFSMNYKEAKTSVTEKYKPVPGMMSQWDVRIIFILFGIIIFWGLISIFLNLFTIRIVITQLMKHGMFENKKESFMAKRPCLIMAMTVVTFAFILGIVRMAVTQNFVIMASQLLVEYSWLVGVILVSILLRVDNDKIKNTFRIYSPLMLVGFIVIVFRIILIPNDLVNLIFPPVLLLCALWQWNVIGRKHNQVLRTDKTYAFISLAVFGVSTIFAWTGFTLLAVQLIIWWTMQLTCVLTITCCEGWLSVYAKRKKLADKAITDKWLYRFIYKVLLPISGVLSFIISIYWAADVFNMSDTTWEIFNKDYIKTSNFTASLFSISEVACLYFLFNYINISPSFNYTEKWYFKKQEYQWNPTTNQTDTLASDYGFYRLYNYNFNVSASTTVYGMYDFTKKRKDRKIQAIRHTLTPSIGFSYTPDFGDPKYGYYQTRQTDSTGRFTTYSPYSVNAYGVPSSGRSMSMNFSLSQNLEMKVLSKRDTSGVKKIKLIDELRISGSYNFLADSMRLSTIPISFRTTLFQNFGINLSMTLDPYRLTPDGKRYNKLFFPGRIVSTGWSFGYTFKSRDDRSQSAINDITSIPPEYMNPYYDPYGNMDPVLRRQYMSQMYYDFSLPWNFGFNYAINYNISTGNYPPKGYKKNVTQTVSFNGSLTITPKTGITFQGGYDIKANKLTTSSISISRDLHCWQMSFSWIPFGFHRSWSFNIGVKAASLSDLKYDKSQSMYDNMY